MCLVHGAHREHDVEASALSYLVLNRSVLVREESEQADEISPDVREGRGCGRQ